MSGMNVARGLIVNFSIFFVSSFLLFRLLSPWAKTYWKKDLSIALFQSVVFTVLLFFLGHSTDNRTNPVQYNDIIHALGNDSEELNKEPGILRTGIAGDENKKLISIGIGFDQTKVNEYQLKQVIIRYLNDSAAMTREPNWQKLFLPYSLKIEEIGGNNNGKILAEKHAGATEFAWSD